MRRICAKTAIIPNAAIAQGRLAPPATPAACRAEDGAFVRFCRAGRLRSSDIRVARWTASLRGVVQPAK